MFFENFDETSAKLPGPIHFSKECLVRGTLLQGITVRKELNLAVLAGWSNFMTGLE